MKKTVHNVVLEDIAFAGAFPAESTVTFDQIADDVLTGRCAAVAVDTVVGVVEPFLTEGLEGGTAPVADEKVVIAMVEVKEVAPGGVAVAPVVFHQTP